MCLGSEGTEKLAILMNDVFDVLNGRFYDEGISNNKAFNDSKGRTVKEVKFTKLNAMLNVLDVTEEFQANREKNSDSPSEPFCSTTTLRALRLTINSAMALTTNMLENGYHTILTGKWNQDPIEVNVISLWSKSVCKSDCLQSKILFINFTETIWNRPVY